MIPQKRIKELNQGRYLLGVTGSIGCGKTYACRKLSEEGNSLGIDISEVNLDHIRRDILKSNPLYSKLRQKLAGEFGNHIMNHNSSIDRKELGQIIFYNEDAMDFFQKTTFPAIKEQLKSHLASKKGLVLTEWALLIEDGLLPFVNNNVLLVTCNPEKQIGRLSDGDLPMDEIIRRATNQFSNEEKERKIKEIQERTQNGQLYVLDTTSSPTRTTYKLLLEEITSSIK
jgi:dephospho-CoA kinase